MTGHHFSPESRQRMSDAQKAAAEAKRCTVCGKKRALVQYHPAPLSCRFCGARPEEPRS